MTKIILDWAATFLFLLGAVGLLYARLQYKPRVRCKSVFDAGHLYGVLSCQLKARHAGLHLAANGAQWMTVTHAAYTGKVPFDNSSMASIARLRKG